MRRVLSLLAFLLMLSGIAAAHPSDELVQAAYLQLTPDSVELELDLTPGELVAAALLKRMDVNNDGALERREAETYAAVLLRNLSLKVDGKALPLELMKVTMPQTGVLLNGGGTLQLIARATLPAQSGAHTLEFSNVNAPVKSGYLSNAFVQSERLQMNQQTRNADQSAYRLEYTLAGTNDLGAIFPGLAAAIIVTISGAAFLWWRSRSRPDRAARV
jgi:hypothetical protein